METKPDDWAIVAYGLLVCIAAICITYLFLRLWPRQHYPRFFAVLAGTAAVAAMYVYQVPGAGFALGALGIVFYIGMFTADALFEASSEKVTATKAVPRTPPSGLGHIALGCLLGLLVSLAAVSSVIMPPASLREWVFHREPLHERVLRAMNPNKEWADLVTREREARQQQSKLQAENAALSKRATDAEAALSNALDELGAATSNTVRGIVVKQKSGSRHANGLVYIGVDFTVSTPAKCYSIASSDKVDSTTKGLQPGEAIKLSTSKGPYRVVLIGIADSSCTFDLVRE